MKKRLPLIILIIAFMYYLGLSAKEWTWIFTSGDSGDWLAASVKWMVPQTYGSPLYISLGHIINLIPGNLALNMTLLLSVLPSTITVMLVFLIVRKLADVPIAVTCSIVLLGSSIFLTQSTVLEEYAITVMFLTGALWFYLTSKRKLTALFLGLGTAVHIFIIPLMFFWLLVDRRWKYWLGWTVVIYILAGLLPYGLILLLMSLDTPKFLAGYLSWGSLVNYWTMTSRAIIGEISLAETPERLLLFVRLILGAFGLALLPMLIALKKPILKFTLILISITLFTFWYFITCLDVNAWTFICFATPALVILAGIGLARLPNWHFKIVGVFAIFLMCANIIFLNANTLAQQNPTATTYETSLKYLPWGSVVVTQPGAYSLGLFYVINQGYDLIPLIYPYLDKWKFTDYGVYLQREYQVSWTSTLQGVSDALKSGKHVYYYWTEGSTPIGQCFEFNGNEIIGLTGLQPKEDFIRTK